MASNEATAAHANAQKNLDLLLTESPVYRHFFHQHITLSSATSNRVTCLMTIQPHHLNSKNSLHGSVIATLVDLIGGIVIAASYWQSGRQNTGVSADMHISFVGGAKLGETVSVEGVAEKVGGSLAFTTVLIKRVDPNELNEAKLIVARASHTKFVRERSGGGGGVGGSAAIAPTVGNGANVANAAS